MEEVTFTLSFNVILPPCAHGIELHEETLFQIVLCLNMLTINCLGSDSKSLNQHWPTTLCWTGFSSCLSPIVSLLVSIVGIPTGFWCSIESGRILKKRDLVGKVYNMWHLLWEEVKGYIVGPGYFCHEWLRYNKSEVLSQYMGICAIVPVLGRLQQEDHLSPGIGGQPVQYWVACLFNTKPSQIKPNIDQKKRVLINAGYPTCLASALFASRRRSCWLSHPHYMKWQ